MTAHRGIRYREDVGWELRCESCADKRGQSYWPLTLEFWAPGHTRGMSRCRACWAEWDRFRRQNKGRTTPEIVQRNEELRAKKRADFQRKYNREWMRRHRERLNAA